MSKVLGMAIHRAKKFAKSKAKRLLNAMPPRIKLTLHRILDAVRPQQKLTAVGSTPVGLGENTDAYGRPFPDPNALTRLIIGPANHAEQAWHWCRAAEKHIDSVSAISMSRLRSPLRFRTDYAVEMPAYRNAKWSETQEAWIDQYFTHVLIDGIRPILGPRVQDDCLLEVAELKSLGLNVGLIAHGSEIRIPSMHADLYPTSPFRNVPAEDKDRVAIMEKNTQVWNKFFNEFDGPTFVSTVDLLDFAPKATYLPTIVIPEEWKTSKPISLSPKPTVLHLPTNGLLKGSHLIDPILQKLDQDGVIKYLRLESVPPTEVPNYIEQADIVVEQVVLGLYSVMAIQTMAAGRLAIAHIPDRVRARSLDGNVPVLDATGENLEAVIREVIANPAQYEALAARGPAFVDALHTGKASAEAMRPFLAKQRT